MPAVDDFFKTVLRSGLLTRDQLREALRPLPRDRREDPDAVADWLVKEGKLSRFQADKLLEGTALGLVLGPYQVLAPIARGGMGTVYLARDARSQQLVALKILPPRKAREEGRLLARFRREMEMCQRVAHPHLAWTHEVGVYQGVYYIAMEYIPGRNLHRLVLEDGPLAVSRAARLFGEVASALEHAHVQGLIHRDLKPSNIIVTPHDHAKLLDLGLAIMQGEGTLDREVVGGQGYIVGTMDYLAPEQAADACRVDPRCDLYALGCTLYYALTARPPFPDGTNKEKIHFHRSGAPVPLSRLNPEVPAGFAALVDKLMAKDPDCRYASASALHDALTRWMVDEPVRPLDRPDDSAYQEAVAVLATAEPAAELSSPLEQRHVVRRRRPRGTHQLVEAVRQRAPAAQPRLSRPVVMLLLAAVLATISGLSGLLYYLALR